MKTSFHTAAHFGLARCHACSTLSKMPPKADHARCPRCHAPLHFRKPHSLLLTWLYTLSATIMYIPANLLTMMKTQDIYATQEDTIFSGIVFLWTGGSAPLAIIVFIASILVPSIKLVALYYLLICAHQKTQNLRMERIKLYRFLEFIGRWSMLDIFVVAILAALVDFPGVALVSAGPGAAAFGLVVVLTLLATHSFDPRLIWDDPTPTPAPSSSLTEQAQ